MCSDNSDSGNGGGDTPTVFVASPAEAQTQLEDGREVKSEECQYSDNMPDNVSSKEYRYLPNMSYDVSEVSQEYYQGVPVTQTFTVTRRYRIPDGVYYGIAIALALGGYFLFDSVKRASLVDYVKGILTGSKNSQESASTVKESKSVEGFKRPRGEGKGVETGGGSPTTINVIDTGATAKLMLEIFVCYKRGAITKGGAICILTTYYNLSQAEALQVLEEE